MCIYIYIYIYVILYTKSINIYTYYIMYIWANVPPMD